MLIIGAMGHAKEILDVLDKQNKLSDLYFFDNVTYNLPDKLYDVLPVIRTETEVKQVLAKDPSYVLGIGGCQIRHKLAIKMNQWGGILSSIIAHTANIGNYNVELGNGINIMHGAFISNDVKIGHGSLVNTNSHIHHDVTVGRFCEISPGAILTGRVQVGEFTTIGSNAVINPRIKIGKNVVIGAGAVVNKNIQDNVVAVGVPAKVIKFLPAVD